MRIGTVVPAMGALASPELIVRAAQHAESLDYDSLWVGERVLYPVNPQTPYGGVPGEPLPEFYKRVFTPLETLAYVAAHTRRIALGTSLLVMPFHNPVLVARQLTTLDVLSGGRLRVGLGQGWSKDEYEATGAALDRMGARADEFIKVLQAIWGPDPVRFEGEFFRVPASILQPKPVRQPRPPIYLAAYTPSALRRVARLADGWLPTGIPLANVGPMMEQVRLQAREVGRDPAALELIILAHLSVTEDLQENGRADFTGNLEQIRQDIQRARELGANEIILNPRRAAVDLSEDGLLRALEQLRELAGR
jgi:probable F420-dependent oxidoreductase